MREHSCKPRMLERSDMSSLTLPFRLLLASASAAALGLFACGGDDSGSASPTTGSSDTKADAAVHKDGGSAKTDASTGVNIPGLGSIPAGAVEGDDCSSLFG